MLPKLKQRLLGLLLIAIGVWLNVSEWRGAAATGQYHPKYAVLFPFFAVVGLLLVLFPMDKEELLLRYGVEKPSSLAHYSWGQKILLVAAIVAGALNWALLSGTLHL